jgi:hypothetical protein
MAQKTKELATFQVYMLLMHVYFGVLDEKTKLPLYDPSLTFNQRQINNEQQQNPLDRLQPTSVTEANLLDPRTVQVRKLLRHAMFDRFYKRYHTRLAYKDRRVRTPAIRKDLHFSYLFDIQAVLHPALSDCKLLHRIVMSLPDVTTDEKQRHFNNIHAYIWRTISQLVQQVAYQLLTNDTTTSEQEELTVPEPGKKKQRLEDPTLALLESMVPVETALQRENAQLNPHEVASKEIRYYQKIEKDQWPKFEDTLTWWKSRHVLQHLPCMSQVALALLGCLPSSGGLECDFSKQNGVLYSRHASLGQGFLETELLL